MAQYLRDEQLEYLTIDEDVLSRLVDALVVQMDSMPEVVQGRQNPAAQPPAVQAPAGNGAPVQAPPAPALDAILIMTIRFDGKGYRVFSKERLLQYFAAASTVERIVIELSSMRALQTSKNVGSNLDVRLDVNETVASHVISTSDDENWMNASFGAVRELLAPCKNKYALAKNPLVEMVLQLFGVFVCFVLSAWGATLIAPNLNVENAFLLSFVLVLLVLSNLWGFMNRWLKAIVTKAYPKIVFYRPHKNRLHWLIQAVVGGLIAALVLFLLGQSFDYAGRVLGFLVERA